MVIILIKFVQGLIHLEGGEENGNEHVVRNDDADDQVDVYGASVGPRVSPSFLVEIRDACGLLSSSSNYHLRNLSARISLTTPVLVNPDSGTSTLCISGRKRRVTTLAWHMSELILESSSQLLHVAQESQIDRINLHQIVITITILSLIFRSSP